MNTHQNKVLFSLFFISGFCSLLYQVVWVRMAFAAFGIVTPVLSVVISVFMLGLSIGSWTGGKLITHVVEKSKINAIIFYATAEALIGVGAFMVPKLFLLGETLLLRVGESNSLSYFLLSALSIVLSIFPWCYFMGTTFPFMMAFIKQTNQPDAKSFSYLYLGNVLGAMLGTFMTAVVLVEAFGFQHTLWFAGCGNFLIAAVSLLLGINSRHRRASQEAFGDPNTRTQSTDAPPIVNLILFMTGFTSLALEVIWTRAFTPVIKTQVYAFSLLLFVYLLATWAGSYLYRRHVVKNYAWSTAELMAMLSAFAFFPIVLNDPRFYPARIIPSLQIDTRVIPILISIFPFCSLLGYLTPKLIDERSSGSPKDAGRAYALNILGCILGPLFASYVFLPLAGAKISMLVLALPFTFFFLLYSKSLVAEIRWGIGLATGVLLATSAFVNVSYEDPRGITDALVVRRDHTATVISAGEGLEKRLFVNGVGITQLTSITKFMAHLPLAFHRGEPRSALVICFGMGTTYRSLLSWGVQTTAVELVPSVKDAFGYYFDDAAAVLRNPKGQIIIDDGRRFLRRTSDRYDVVTLDPPPPAEAAGSSLLFSENFYELVKSRLNANGILQQWFAFGEEKTLAAVARSLGDSFPCVRVYRSVEGWGYHFLASMEPIEAPTAEEIARRLPERARVDLLEWGNDHDLKTEINRVLSREIPLARLIDPDPHIKITDDQPFNEYFLLRHLLGKPICLFAVF